MKKTKFESLEKEYSYISTDGSGIGMVVIPFTESYVPKETEEISGVTFKRADRICFDVNLIPEYVRDELARATMEALKEWMKDPEKRRMIEERAAKINASKMETESAKS